MYQEQQYSIILQQSIHHYISANQTTTSSAENINSASASILLNTIQNLDCDDGINYVINGLGYFVYGDV